MPISFTGQQQFSYFLSRHLENVPNVTSSHLQTLPNYCLQVKHLYWFKVNVPESLVKSELRKFHSFIKRLGRKSQLRLNTRKNVSAYKTSSQALFLSWYLFNKYSLILLGALLTLSHSNTLKKFLFKSSSRFYTWFSLLWILCHHNVHRRV